MSKIQRRPRGEGSIKITPQGNYKMTITIGTGIDGRQKRKSVTAKTKAELMKRVAELRIATGTSKSPKGTLRFSEVVEAYLKAQEELVRPSTLENVSCVIKNYFTPLFDYYIDKITPEMIDHILDKARETVKPATVRSIKVKLAAI